MTDYLITYLNHGFKPFSVRKIVSTSILCAVLCVVNTIIPSTPDYLKVAPWIIFAIYIAMSMALLRKIAMPRFCCYYHYAISSSAISLILISNAFGLLSIYFPNVILWYVILMVLDSLIMMLLCYVSYERVKNAKMTVDGTNRSFGFFLIFPILGMTCGAIFFKPSSNEGAVLAIAIILICIALVLSVISINFNKAYIILHTPNAEEILNSKST